MKSGYFSRDTEIFLKLLTKYDVHYLIVGGEAVIYYGYPRLTGDIDIYYSATQKNITNLYMALLEFWDHDIPGIQSQTELQVSGYIIQFGIPPNRIDLMNTIDGISFDKAWSNRSTDSLIVNGEEIDIYFLGLSELIANKKSSGRSKDLDDLDYLKKL